MKKIILPIAILAFAIAYSQVGINIANPNATMDIAAKTTDGSKPEGLIAPRLTGDQIRAANSQYNTVQTGAIVFASSADSAPAGKTINITTSGYYYFDGSLWQKVTNGSSYDTSNDAWANNSANNRVELGTLSNGSTARPAGTEFVALDNGNVGIGRSNPTSRLEVSSTSSPQIKINNNANSGNWAAFRMENSNAALTGYNDGLNISLLTTAANPEWTIGTYGKSYGDSSLQGKFQITNYSTYVPGIVMESDGKVGIGTKTPDASAVLDVSATNKGFLPPRFTLTSSTDATSIASPATGLTVYHSGNANLVAGLYTNIGTPASPNWSRGNAQVVDANNGSEVKKLQVKGNYNNTASVINGPLEFRMTGTGNSGNLTYQVRLISAPAGNVVMSFAGIWGMGGVSTGGGDPLGSDNATFTFTPANWNIYQDLSSIAANLNGHLRYLSVDTSNISGYTLPLFYMLLAQRVDGAGGVKSMITTRY